MTIGGTNRAPVERDVSWRRPRNRRLLIGGSPLTLLRVAEPAVASLDAIERGDGGAVDPVLLERLLRVGVVHRRAAAPVDPKEVTVVIPALVRSEAERQRLCDLVSSLAPLSVVVVDDHSPITLSISDTRCSVVRRDRTGGPAAARNTGLGAVDTPLVAFVDSDCLLDDGGLGPAGLLCGLASHVSGSGDLSVVVAAPRLVSRSRPSVLARYESTASPLDMGPSSTLVRPGARVSYVPAAVLVARVDALREVGGFDESYRFGEDVDLLWRLAAGGKHCVYDASFTAHHEPRPTLAAMLRQRFGYGLGAAPLARRHRCPPFRGHAIVTAGIAAVGLGWWQAGLGLLALSGSIACLRLARHGVDVSSAVAVVVAGQLATARHLARAVSREWLPFAVLAAVFNVRAAIALAVAFVIPAFVRWWSAFRAGRRTDPLSTVILSVLDHLAYSAGVWTGMLRVHSPTAILPSLRLSL